MTRSLPGNPDFEGGTLEVGKLVDFVVWSENRTRCPPERTSVACWKLLDGAVLC